MPNLTLEDIARQAGVSRSTVSRVVNDLPHVSSDARERVLEVIERTGFHPNAAARTLASKRSWMIGLVLRHDFSSLVADHYFSPLAQGIAQACDKYNYTLGLFLVGMNDDDEKIFQRISRQGFLDGILLLPGPKGDVIIDKLLSAKIPFVVAGRSFHNNDISYIDVDNINGASDAVSHLIRQGYKRIGLIAAPRNTTVGVDREAGYTKALVQRGLNVDPALIVEGDFSETSGYVAMKQLLAIRPDAIFAASDTMAIGAMRAVREAGLAIPDDVAFVSFDDLPLAALQNPRLSTIRQPVMQFGYNAVEILIDIIENGIEPQRRVVMNTELIIRDSCGASRKK